MCAPAATGNAIVGVYTSREESAVNNFRPTQIAAFLVASACACRPTPASVPASTPSSAGPIAWNIELTQTGGLAGVDLSVQITSGGQLVAANRRSGHTSTSRVSEDQIGELGRLYAAAASAQYADHPSACADCFGYELTLTSGQQSRTIRLDDVSMAGTAAEPLIAYLTGLRDAALAAP